ncbi:unnamed protein product [Schistocephalus solidus]|uniref:UPF0506 domain-containing protein n=1 Tax=Schistocephalus solidus TaxID=70667 RepID=A0A183TB18_SCHSO|nr:unnamed protein product [Schistocephalus solidus]
MASAEVIYVRNRICVEKGQFCSNRGLAKCCDGLICDKDGPRSGKCVRCLASGKRCFYNRTCCSKRCSWFTCTTCVKKGQFCSNRGFAKCCDGLICEKDGPRSGKCVRCLSSGKMCVFNSECCSKNCSWFRCE